MSIRDLDSLFRPASVALIGASNRPGSVGQVLARNLIGGGFAGPVLPVNPTQKAVCGMLAWPSVEALPMVPEMAVVAVPPDAVPATVAALRAKGTKAAAIITAGFNETDPVGAARKRALMDAAGPMRLLGPNILGLSVPGCGLNAGFAHIAAAPGDLALVSQSGAIVTTVLDWASARGIGFSHLVSVGDMADVDFGDCLDYLTLQPEVRAILLYVEAVTHARKFMSAARRAAATKPVLVIKAGRSAAAARAAASHTGALAGSDAVYEAAFRRAGMLRVHDMVELFAAVETLSSAPRLSGDRLFILSNGGGVGVLATDSLDEMGGILAELSPATRARLDRALPPTWSHANPVDIIGDAPGARYAEALAALLADPGGDAVLVLNCPTAVGDSTEAATAVIAAVQAAPERPVLTSWIGGNAMIEGRRRFAAARIPTYDTPDQAVQAFMHLVRDRRNRTLLMQAPRAAGDDPPPDRAAAAAILDAALAAGRDWLTEPEAKELLKAYGIPVAETRIAADPAGAAAAAAALGGVVAVKILSPDITHKSDLGGVVLNLETPEAAGAAAEAVIRRIRAARPDARIDGVTVQQMIRRPGAHELILGLSEDRLFGPVILFGAGGKAVEVLADTAMALPPLNATLAEALIDETRIARLLAGYRDEKPAHRAAIVDALLRLSAIACDLPQVKELDINPLLADAAGVVALDARVRVGPATGAATDRLAILPYPRELEGHVTIRDGTDIPVRPIRPEDAAPLRDTFRYFDREDVRMRFMQALKDLPEPLAARLTQLDYAREMAFLALDPADGGILGVARLAADPDGRAAEYAIILRSAWKGRGLGYALMRRLIEHARDRGLSSLWGEVLAENERMLDLCRSLGFLIEVDTADPALRRVSLAL